MTVMTYHWSTIASDDVGAWADLVNHLADVDDTGEYYSARDLTEELQSENLEPARDTWAVWTGDQMVAHGMLLVARTLDADGKVRCWLAGGVHSDHRGRGLGRALLDRMERRASAKAQERHPGTEHFYRASAGLEGSTAQRLLGRSGYRIARYFNVLVRPIPGPATPVVDVEGITFRPVRDDDESAVRDAHLLAFADHWGSTPPTEQGWHERWTASSARPADSVLAVDDQTGEVLSYVLAAQWVERQLYLNTVGTVPQARGRGLAGQALARVITGAAASGAFEELELDVDAVNPTGATRLYERVGFTLKHTTVNMQKDPVHPSG